MKLMMTYLPQTLALSLVGIMMIVMSGGTSAFAFERTMTCYPTYDERTPTCEAGQHPVSVRWFDACTTWRTDDQFPYELLAPIQKSFQTWNDVDGSYFKTWSAGRTYPRANHYDCTNVKRINQNVISYVNDWSETDSGSDVIALTSVIYNTETGEILDAGIRMNGEHFRWEIIEKPTSDVQRVDIQNVMTHEAGHFLGLDHTLHGTYQGSYRADRATMWRTNYPNDTSRRELDDDDILGLQAIYPLTQTPAEACTPPERLDHVVSPPDFDGEQKFCEVQAGCQSTTREYPATQGPLFLALLFLLSRRSARSTILS